jgi:hypothetical protein
MEVATVLQASRIPQGKRFRVQTGDMQVFELVYKEFEDIWFIEQIR